MTDQDIEGYSVFDYIPIPNDANDEERVILFRYPNFRQERKQVEIRFDVFYAKNGIPKANLLHVVHPVSFWVTNEVPVAIDGSYVESINSSAYFKMEYDWLEFVIKNQYADLHTIIMKSIPRAFNAGRFDL